ncbi:FAD/NAD(P)-binding protein [Hymenobacter terrestris]|uniref:FAD/NAD(P)-binding protein n=1 Tax=Hymenobacter terrestris TaxID=2748310 RepID=A0ABX2Q4S6_9BACT|nr:FAD/NAD(P)-binding protein [Hymenobacter terrestris]NVO85975.1 FAD/NAD(P)-binding protein [Hymenobacter terrestris]
MQRRSITIIGGGFSGSMLAVQLARLAGQPFQCDVHLVEPRPAPGPGLAYTARRSEYLLNVPVKALSAFPEEPDHFQNWLRVTGAEQDCQAGFCTRQSYGRYLQQLVGQVIEWPSMNGMNCQWHNSAAQSIEPNPDGTGAVVRLRNGELIRSDLVVLALGNFPPAIPTPLPHNYLNHPGYHGSPWASRALSGIKPTDDVLLLGSGLTAVDVLLGLRADGHKGRLTVVSQHGRWPAAAVPGAPSYPSFWATELAGLSSVGAVLRVVRQHVATAQAQGLPWQPVLDSLRPDLPRIWAGWPLAEQSRFLRHLAGIWSVLRHRSPPGNAETVRELLISGRVEQVRGRAREIAPTDDDLLVTVSRPGHPDQQLTAQHVITCTGPLLDYRRIQEPLVVQLREAGLLTPDSLGLGMLTDADGALLDAFGQASDMLFTLGPSRRPAYFESTAVPELRAQAVTMARLLGQRLRQLERAEV